MTNVWSCVYLVEMDPIGHSRASNLKQFQVRGIFLARDHLCQHLWHDFGVPSHDVKLTAQPDDLNAQKIRDYFKKYMLVDVLEGTRWFYVLRKLIAELQQVQYQVKFHCCCSPSPVQGLLWWGWESGAPVWQRQGSGKESWQQVRQGLGTWSWLGPPLAYPGRQKNAHMKQLLLCEYIYIHVCTGCVFLSSHPLWCVDWRQCIQVCHRELDAFPFQFLINVDHTSQIGATPEGISPGLPQNTHTLHLCLYKPTYILTDDLEGIS